MKPPNKIGSQQDIINSNELLSSIENEDIVKGTHSVILVLDQSALESDGDQLLKPEVITRTNLFVSEMVSNYKPLLSCDLYG
jgi:hypothetical protein